MDCPLFGLRPLSLRQRRAFVHSLTSEELEYLGSYHSCCYVDKVAARAR